jgi:hypothetical protein
MQKLIILILLSFTALSQIPNTISYQGQILDNVGNPVPNGNISATFSLHDASENGNQFWFEVQSFNTTDGVFNVELGSSTPLTSLNFDNPLWLEILIEGDGAALSPRIELTTNPFSRNVATVVGGRINNSEIGNISPSAGTFTRIEVSGNSISAPSATLSISSIDLGTSTLYIPNSVGNGTVLTSDGSGNATWETLPASVNLDGDETIGGNWDNTSNPWADDEVADNLTISGGSIENTAIGSSSPSGGTFTSLRLSSGSSDGHVLTSDANGNATWQAAAGGGGGSVPTIELEATQAGGTSIPTGSSTKIPWTETSDPNNQFVTDTFTAATDGFYKIDVLLSGTGAVLTIALYKNGLFYWRGESGGNQNNANSDFAAIATALNVLIELNQNDTIDIRATSNNNGQTTALNSKLQIIKIN